MLESSAWRVAGTFAVETSILPENMCIAGLLLLILKILVYGLGAAATVGVVIAGIQYMTARDNESQVAAAKQRLLNIVIGLVAWAVMWTVMNWLIPGGMTLDTSQSFAEVCPEDQTDSNNGGSASGGNASSGGNNTGTNNSTGGNQGNNNNQGGNDTSQSNNHTVNGVTKVEYEGTTYAFPLKGATQTNIKAINDLTGTSQQGNGWAHWPETGYMLDLMLYNGPGDPMTDVPVVAITSGTIAWRAPFQYPSSCAAVGIYDDKGGVVEYIHLKAESSVPQVGAHVNAGDVIGHVGPSLCTATAANPTAQTAPHLHLQVKKDTFSGSNTQHEFREDLSKLINVMNALWEVLPE